MARGVARRGSSVPWPSGIVPYESAPGYVRVYTANATASSTWTTNSPSFSRYGTSYSSYYYDTYQVTVPVDSSYNFMSISRANTYGYLYNGSFRSSSTSSNLLTFDDDSGGNRQFRFTFSLQRNLTYIFVPTTYSMYTTGAYTVVVSGPELAILVRTSTTGGANTSSEYTLKQYDPLPNLCFVKIEKPGGILKYTQIEQVRINFA
ncbi:unnamed protein product [Rotaria sp. Silwood2]|nr:unnamed protein product [Rotaria sp. Silwood2]CAF2638807.1 unnamed protein product [Rotaria sp. Silwood2]CAF3074781.1 unnamed protein product [Rotaria sp. Silwood2]CAF4059821.1 unnamed protein product [Rotaria sp. Silwood2]CAF4150894.1 unnamed protein product [Rotaria sp. Silwood2]